MGTSNPSPVELDPFLFSYWIAVSVTRLEMGIYYDSMTPKEKKPQKWTNTKKQTKEKRN